MAGSKLFCNFALEKDSLINRKMIQLKENQGIPRSILLMMSIIAGLTVANCYYNQPLLELIRHDLDITEQSANLITVITQIGYALGLFFLIPMGDMFSRKKLILVNMTIAALMAIVMAVAQNVWMLWGASLLIGACSVIPDSSPHPKTRAGTWALCSPDCSRVFLPRE